VPWQSQRLVTDGAGTGGRAEVLSQHLCARLERWDNAPLSRKAAAARLGPVAATEECHTS